MPSSKKQKREIDSYLHESEERVNNPPVGLVEVKTDPDVGQKQLYEHDPHLDPQFNWAGKAERTSFEVPTVSLHVHERIDPHSIMEAVRKRNGSGNATQGSLFDEQRNIPLRQEIEFYKHSRNWSNRLIAGDSLLVMNSLLQKENMTGKVQCFYMDPPYGIKYGSNFQPFTNQREVKDGKGEDLTTEPEMIKAFRDTWELGTHSYLSYMRDRLVLAKEMLTDSGSCFVQIGDDNVHRVGLVLDDIFGAENRMATISFATSSGSSTKYLPEVADYLLWYTKDKDKNNPKYRQLYESLTRKEKIEYFSSYVMVELENGDSRKLTPEERFDPDKYLPKGSRLYQTRPLTSQRHSTTGRSEPYEHKGKLYKCPPNAQWSISRKGMDHLAELGRLEEGPGSLRWKKYENETPGRRINNIWHRQMYETDKKYVVQTSTKPIQRCILMTTDPGDLVFDPTCGSGTTAYVAEQWGRRWITCDTSRVSTTIAKRRLMTASFDYYQLAHPEEGVGRGFKYEETSKVSAAILGYDESQQTDIAYDCPFEDGKKVRVTGPFTVEAVPAPTVQPIDAIQTEPVPADESVGRSGETLRQDEWRDELFKTGIRGKGGQHISFTRIDSLPCRWLHADAEIKLEDVGNGKEPATAVQSRRVVISFGPEHAPLEQRQVENAIQESKTLVPKPDIVVFAAFQFDPEAAKDIAETNWPGVTMLQAQMNVDLQTDDLKKKRTSSESFWLIGQPDVSMEQIEDGEDKGKHQVTVNGFDYFNTKSGLVESGDEKKIAVWMLDTDYDGRSLYPTQVFFPVAGVKDGWTKLAKNLKAEIDEELIEAYKGTISLPFNLGANSRIAVKIVDTRGIESLKVVEI